jgi:hypothetical protein
MWVWRPLAQIRVDVRGSPPERLVFSRCPRVERMVRKPARPGSQSRNAEFPRPFSSQRTLRARALGVSLYPATSKGLRTGPTQAPAFSVSREVARDPIGTPAFTTEPWRTSLFYSGSRMIRSANTIFRSRRNFNRIQPGVIVNLRRRPRSLQTVTAALTSCSGGMSSG